MSTTSLIIPRHAVPNGHDGLSPLQYDLIHHPSPIRICSAPTGAGKSYAFIRAALEGANVLFFVPTRRLAQNLHTDIIKGFQSIGNTTKEEALRRVALWTSDSRAQMVADGLDPRDIREQRNRQMRQVAGGLPETGSFLIATPESVAHYLCGNSARYGFAAQDRSGLADLLQRHHIVFDEFHTIGTRGYGIAMALAAIVHKEPVSAHAHRPKVSFLSATPVDITTVLEKTGVPADAVIHLHETIKNHTPDPGLLTPTSTLEDVLRATPPAALSQARWVHGDVRIDMDTTAPSLSALVALHAPAVREALFPSDNTHHKAQIVLVYDTLDAQNADRNALLAALEPHGITPKDIHIISSIHDSAHSVTEEAGISGHGRNPMDSRIISATSSVEMGVTLRSRLMFIEPGHSLASFVQRIGRVARGGLNGAVVVRAAPSTNPHQEWFNRVRERFASMAADTPSGNLACYEISTFVGALLESLSQCFDTKGVDFSTTSTPTLSNIYDKMPLRAAWCAALFWVAMQHARNRDGNADTLSVHQPPLAKAIWALIYKIKNSARHPGDTPQKRWISAFIAEALTLRVIAPRVIVQDPVAKRSLPWSHFSRNEVLMRMPLLIDENGAVYVASSVSLTQAMDAPKAAQSAKLFYDLLLPHTVQTLHTKAGEEVQTWQKFRAQAARDWGIDPEEEKAIAAANTLMLCTGIIPKADSAQAAGFGEGAGLI